MICRLFGLIFSLLIVGPVAAQSTHSGFGQLELALVNGDKAVNAQVSLTAGWERKGLLLGLGTGIDYYRIRSVPIFLSLQQDFKTGDLHPYAYARGGRNIAWALTNQFHSVYNGPANSSSFDGGWYAEAGAGLRLFARKKTNMTIGLGYSMKTMSEDWQEYIYDPVSYERSLFPRQQEYTFNRILFKVGVLF